MPGKRTAGCWSCFKSNSDQLFRPPTGAQHALSVRAAAAVTVTASAYLQGYKPQPQPTRGPIPGHMVLLLPGARIPGMGGHVQTRSKVPPSRLTDITTWPSHSPINPSDPYRPRMRVGERAILTGGSRSWAPPAASGDSREDRRPWRGGGLGRDLLVMRRRIIPLRLLQFPNFRAAEGKVPLQCVEGFSGVSRATAFLRAVRCSWPLL